MVGPRGGGFAWRTLLGLLLLIAVSEVLIMVFFSRELPVPWSVLMGVTARDAGVLALVLTPFIYFAFIRPHQRLEARLSNLLESAPDVIIGFDREGRIDFLNARAVQFFGYTAQELSGQYLWEFLHAAAVPSARDALQNVRHGGPLQGVELTIRTKDGATIIFEAASLPAISGDEGRGGVAILRDISSRKVAEARLRRRLEFEQVLARVSARFVGRGELDEAIGESLADVGRLSGASRAYLCLLRPGGEIIDRALEWCPEGSALEIEGRSGAVLSGFPWLRDQLRRGAVVRIDDIASLPREAQAEKEEFSRRNARAVLILPLQVAGELAGFLGFDLVPAAIAWSDEDLALLQVLSAIIGRSLEQRRSAAAIEQSEERYRALFDNAHDLIQSVAADGTFLFVNAAWLRATGYTAEEVRSLTIYDVLDHRKRERCTAVFQKVVAGEDQAEIAATLVAKDGHAVEVEGSVTGRRENGVVTATYAILRDVTEHNRMEERVFRVQQDWKSAFDALTDMITVHDADFNIVHANKAAQQILGLPLLGESGAKCFSYFHGTACPPQGCPSCVTLQTGKPTTQEIYEPHLGRYLEIRGIPRFDREQRIIGLIHVVRDISERKRSEDALRESERQYRLLFEDNPHPMWVYDTETLAILAVNEAAVGKYGYSREEFLALSIKDLRPPEDVPVLLRSLEQRRSGLEQVGVWRHRRKDGTLLFVDITRHTMPFAGKQAVLVLANDVSEQQQLEEQLRHAQKMEAVGQLAGGVAHDFNNILSVIGMYGNLLEEQLPAGELRGFAGQILVSAERAATLTRSLLAFSRKQLYHLAPVDLDKTIGDLAKLLQRLLGEEIELRTVRASRPLVVLADRGQLEQVVMNLCMNARDAMPRGGRLTLETSGVSLDDEFLRVHGFGVPGDYALLTVTDTGQGMDEATRQRIFEPFFTTKEVGKGTGLGLAIVYGIVKQHRGFITVSSRPGAGTAVALYLPVVRAAGLAEEKSASVAPPGGTECILLAEDEEELRTITAAVLSGQGYRVIEAVDGEDALGKFKEADGQVRLFLTDVVMPRMNGREAYEEMVRLDPGLKVLYTSGYTADVIEQKGIGSGDIHFLAKPTSPIQILRKVRDVLDGRQAGPLSSGDPQGGPSSVRSTSGRDFPR